MNLTRNIKFKNFILKKPTKKIKNLLSKVLSEKNEVLLSLSKEYKNSYIKKKIIKFKNYSRINIIGLGGVILGEAEFVENKLHDYLKHTGPALSPFNAWVMMKGLETLAIRTDKQIENANLIAEYLKTLSGVSQVIYPGHNDHPQFEITQKQMIGGGPMVAFKINGGKDEAFNFLNKLEIVKISNNLGDAKSLITHPSTTTHRSLSSEEKAVLGITDNTLRLSVGLEDVSDIIEDLNFAISILK